MKLLPMLTLVSAVMAGGIVASQHLNQKSNSSDLVVSGAAIDPVMVDIDDVLRSLSPDAQTVEMTRSPFLEGKYASGRWLGLHDQARRTASQPQGQPVAKRRVQGRIANVTPKQKRNRDRINPRTSRRRSIFETSRSYFKNGSALERGRGGRSGRRSGSFQFSRPFRSGVMSRLRSAR